MCEIIVFILRLFLKFLVDPFGLSFFSPKIKHPEKTFFVVFQSVFFCFTIFLSSFFTLFFSHQFYLSSLFPFTFLFISCCFSLLYLFSPFSILPLFLSLHVSLSFFSLSQASLSFFSIADLAYLLFVCTHFSFLSFVLDLICLDFFLLHPSFSSPYLFLPKKIKKILCSFFTTKFSLPFFFTLPFFGV